MTDTLTLETFEHLVQLAALELTEEESQYLFTQLNKQMRAIQELEDVPLDPDIPITSHGVPYTQQISPATRTDDWIPYSDAEKILEQAPEIDEGYIVVPEIPHIELE